MLDLPLTGLAVGLILGFEEGFEDGVLLGIMEGLKEGLLLGIMEGEGEGIPLGFAVGASDFALLLFGLLAATAMIAELLGTSSSSAPRRSERLVVC